MLWLGHQEAARIFGPLRISLVNVHRDQRPKKGIKLKLHIPKSPQVEASYISKYMGSSGVKGQS